jgi:hypothetical protein
MPCVTHQSPHLQNLGPIVPVIILPSSAFIKALKERSPEEVEKYSHGIQAMISTSKFALFSGLQNQEGFPSESATGIPIG